jgi:multicomponent K+:H+ antiporter subunit E
VKHAPRALPPVLIGVLVVMWLLMNETLALAQIAAGVALAVALALASAGMRPLQPHLKRGYLILGLLLVVLWDIVRSNFAVARIVLGLARGREIEPGFLQVPLELHDPHGLAVLAAIVSSTPGTVWVDLAPDGSRVTLHVLDLKDKAEWIDLIKHRYERPLLRIFQ